MPQQGILGQLSINTTRPTGHGAPGPFAQP